MQHARLVITVLIVLFSIGGLPIAAQTDSPGLTLTAEHNIGFECPVTAAFDTAQTSVWVLMSPCYQPGYSLRAFDAVTGEPLNDDANAYREALAALNGSYANFVSSLGIQPDGTFSIMYSDAEYNMLALTLPMDGDSAASGAGESSDALSGLLASYSEYPETTIFSADHTRAAALGTDSLHILDLETAVELLALPIPGSPDNVFAKFSADGQRLYVAQLINFDDMDDYRSVLTVYSLPDGVVVSTYDVPSPFLWVSPDERYAAASLGSNDGTSEELVVVDLTTGSMSAPVSVYEPPHNIVTCQNSGRDMSDVDMQVSGRLPIRELLWLPDSSGFMTLNDYGGEAAAGGSICIFNYSRLRYYAIG